MSVGLPFFTLNYRKTRPLSITFLKRHTVFRFLLNTHYIWDAYRNAKTKNLLFFCIKNDKPENARCIFPLARDVLIDFLEVVGSDNKN